VSDYSKKKWLHCFVLLILSVVVVYFSLLAQVLPIINPTRC
jgi:hypothetical protein